LGIQGQSLLTAVGKPGTSTLVSISRALVTFAITVPLTSWLGAAGAALAFVLGSILLLPVVTELTRRYVSGPISRWYGPRDIFAVLLAYAAGFVAARAVDGALDGIAGLPAALTAGVSAYAAAFVAAGGVRQRDVQRLRDVLRSRGFQRPRAIVGASRDAS
jgi:O-antigen/teichoic acid export membrane protein